MGAGFRGVFTLREASSLTRLPYGQAYRWTARNRKPGTSHLYSRSYGKVSGSVLLSFNDVIELHLVREMTKRGLAVARIRRLVAMASDAMETSHPFAVSGGVMFALGGGAKLAMVDNDGAVDVENKQQLLLSELAHSYFNDVLFDDNKVAAKWWPRSRQVPVVVDPSRNFGAPQLERSGVPVEILAAAVAAGDSVEAVARWYGVEPSEVAIATEFEEWRTAPIEGSRAA